MLGTSRLNFKLRPVIPTSALLMKLIKSVSKFCHRFSTTPHEIGLVSGVAV